MTLNEIGSETTIIPMSLFKTQNYNIFSKLQGNRNLDSKNLNRLEESILEENLLKYNPIIVDKHFNVLDGQHRLDIAKRHNLAIYFGVYQEGNIVTVEKLNTILGKWTLNTYLESKVDQKIEDYTKLQELINEYPNFTTTTFLMLISEINGKAIKTKNKKNINLDFKKGKLIFTEDDKLKVKKLLDIILILYNKNDAMESDKKFYFNRAFTGALLTLSKQPNFDKALLIKKVCLLKSPRIIRKETRREYIELLLSIYNYRNPNPINMKGYKSY